MDMINKHHDNMNIYTFDDIELKIQYGTKHLFVSYYDNDKLTLNNINYSTKYFDKLYKDLLNVDKQYNTIILDDEYFDMLSLNVGSIHMLYDLLARFYRYYISKKRCKFLLIKSDNKYYNKYYNSILDIFNVFDIRKDFVFIEPDNIYKVKRIHTSMGEVNYRTSEKVYDWIQHILLPKISKVFNHIQTYDTIMMIKEYDELNVHNHTSFKISDEVIKFVNSLNIFYIRQQTIPEDLLCYYISKCRDIITNYGSLFSRMNLYSTNKNIIVLLHKEFNRPGELSLMKLYTRLSNNVNTIKVYDDTIDIITIKNIITEWL